MRKYIVGDVVVSTIISEIMVSYLTMIFKSQVMYCLAILLFINVGVFNCGFFNDSTTYRNEYQEYFLGVKAAGA